MGLFEAKAVNFADLPDNPEDAFNSASADARGFAASGGVAQAVVNAIKKMDPDVYKRQPLHTKAALRRLRSASP